MMCVCERGEVSEGGSSFRPIMGVESGAVGQEFAGAMIQPTLSFVRVSESSRSAGREGESTFGTLR